VFLGGCAITENGVVVDLPNTPTVNICQNVATDADVAGMKAKIDKEAYKDDKMKRARFVTKGFCFVTGQIIDIMESFTYDDDKLEIAKDLYDQCTDKGDYDLVADALTYKSNKDELMDYILQNP
jgi:hypothetical protein